jgi:hypothetical protein
MDMRATLLDQQQFRFSLSGECPHCRHQSVFMTIAGTHREPGTPNADVCCAAMQCQGCRGYILGFIYFVKSNPPAAEYKAHYPLGYPDDTVAPEVPSDVAVGFKEALRCRWIKATGATVLMCRRSLQVSCDRENAAGKDLFSQIDDLASKQRITATLKIMAHRIRLLGKKGAHGDYSDIDATITDKDADDALTFMRHYLDHVYVLPERLKEPPLA